VIGAGKTAETMARTLVPTTSRRLIVANRTLINGQFLADRFGGTAIALCDLPEHLAEADVVVSCTASDRPILTASVVEKVIGMRRHKPLFVVDVAQHGDVEESVRTLRDVFFAKSVDLLDDEAFAGVAHDDHVAQAQALGRWHMRQYQAWRRAWSDAATLESLCARAADQRDQGLKKALQLLKAGRSPAEALEFLAQALTNKFMHVPSVNIRSASLRGDAAFIGTVERLFAAERDAS
jgi:glutamyl-tRNA reductase